MEASRPSPGDAAPSGGGRGGRVCGASDTGEHPSTDGAAAPASGAIRVIIIAPGVNSTQRLNAAAAHFLRPLWP
ncbi:hypothetical protein AZA_15451 [Nitrospirillum viridazoti Y2]|nr:hypothetical protein AZA_15451 [Nitrospirillum amazonense Y2]